MEVKNTPSNSVSEASELKENQLELSSLQKEVNDTVKDMRGKTSITDQEAEEYGKYDGPIFLDNVTSLTDAQINSLSKHQRLLDLRGVTSLTDSQLQTILTHRGTLYLNGLKNLTDDQVQMIKQSRESNPHFVFLNSSSLTPQQAEMLVGMDRVKLEKGEGKSQASSTDTQKNDNDKLEQDTSNQELAEKETYYGVDILENFDIFTLGSWKGTNFVWNKGVEKKDRRGRKYVEISGKRVYKRYNGLTGYGYEILVYNKGTKDEYGSLSVGNCYRGLFRGKENQYRYYKSDQTQKMRQTDVYQKSLNHDGRGGMGKCVDGDITEEGKWQGWNLLEGKKKLVDVGLVQDGKFRNDVFREGEERYQDGMKASLQKILDSSDYSYRIIITQYFLRKKGYNIGTVDNIEGPLFKAAVTQFAKDNGITDLKWKGYGIVKGYDSLNKKMLELRDQEPAVPDVKSLRIPYNGDTDVASNGEKEQG